MPEITDKHKAFARAIVATAREHGANHLTVTFDFTSSKAFREEDGYCYQNMRLEWKEGRHGAKEDIKINATEEVRLNETIEAT